MTGQFKCSRKQRVRLIVVLLAVLFVLYNVVAYNQAYTMSHFTDSGERTAKAEKLGGLQKIRVLFTGVKIPRPRNDSDPGKHGLEYETHRLSAGQGVELDAWLAPHPSPKGIVLLFHGYATSRSDVLPQAKAFYDLGYTVFLPDFRGSGGSNRKDTSIGYYEAEDVAASVQYVEKLNGGGLPMILYGDSMGGAAILRAIAVHDVKPNAVILEGVFDRLLSAARNRFHLMGVPAFPSAEFLVFWGGVQMGFSGFKHNPSDYATKVTCPALMLHGAVDPRATFQQARAVFDKLAGKKEFVSFPGTKHESCVEADRMRWMSAVEDFLCSRQEKEPQINAD